VTDELSRTLLGPALVDWCEPNHAVMPAVAEFTNTVTSLVMIAMAAFGLWLTRSHELRFRLGMVGTGFVGLGSALFHATLQRWAQAADELPMMGLGLACAWTMAQRGRRQGEGKRLAAGLLVFGVFFVLAYATATWAFQLFVGVYGVLVVWLAGRTLVLSFVEPAPRAVRRDAVVVVVAYIGSFLLFWLPEHVLLACSHPLQSWHLHGWWHLGAGVGTVAWWWWAAADRARLNLPA